IVRESILTDENTRPIYSGNGLGVELIRRDPAEMQAATAAAQHAALVQPASATTTSSTNAATAMLGSIAAQNRPLAPGAVQPSSAAVAPRAITVTPRGTAAPVSLSIVPSASVQSAGSSFQVAVPAANAAALYSNSLGLQFDPR